MIPKLGKGAWIAAAAAVAVGGFVLYESLRPRPPLVGGVTSRPPESADELVRLSNGFTWSATKDGKKLFDLEAQTLVGRQEGVSRVRDVRRLTLFTTDGKPVVVQASGGSFEQRGGEESDVVAALEGDVAVRGPEGVELRSDKLTFDTATRRLASPGAARIVADGMTADLTTMSYDPDARRVDAAGPLAVALAGDEAWRIDAASSTYDLKGDVLKFDAPFRAARGTEVAAGASAVFRSPRNAARLAATIEGPALAAGVWRGEARWQLAAARMEAAGRAVGEKGGLAARTLIAKGPASLVWRREPAAGGGSGAARAEELRVATTPAGAVSNLVAGPAFSARFLEDGAAEPWKAAGTTLELQFGPDGRLARAEARQKVAAEGPRGLTLEADRIQWEARRPGEVLALGAPARARQAGDGVEAPRLTYRRDQRMLLAEGGPLTESASLRRGDGAIFAADEPVRVRSGAARFFEKAGAVEFDGPVQAWQENATLRAGRMKILRESSRLLADDNVTVTTTLGEAGKADRRRARLSAEHLVYDSASRRIEMTGKAVYEEPGIRVEAEKMKGRLRAGGGVEEMDAAGDVKITAQGNNGAADTMEWRGGPEGTVTLIGGTRPATLESPQQGQAKQRAARIRYDLKEKRGVAEGQGGRTVLEGTPPPEKKEQH